MGILTLKEDKILFANAFFTSICNVPHKTVHNSSFFDYLIDDDKIVMQGYLNCTRKVTTLHPTVLALRFLDGNGKLTHTEATFIQTIDERNEKLIQVVLSDVTHSTELKMKSKHLLTDAIYMSRKLSRFNDLNTELNNIVKKNGLNENDFTKIFHALNEERNLEQLWSVFQKNFDLIYPEFFKKLIQIAPDLTQQEIKHCCFIRLNFETKEIAQMFSVKPTSIQIGRVRIKKKLKLDHDQNLTTFIHLLWKIIRYLISFIAKISLY